MRRAIAAAMSKSKREIPHYYLAATIDMSRALAWTETENQKRSLGDRILPAVLLMKAAALALAESPQLNGFYLDGRFRPADGVHLGLAIAMKGGGLVAPALHHTDRLTLDELMIALHDLIPRARTGRLRSSEMTDSTATLTNLGDLGVETVYGAIYPPQVALVGLGKIARRPWVDGDTVCVRPLLTATLAADHRATDGRYGARFLELFDRRLQKPEEL
jgi:pyruvate dehydrogenase E2 component (dihydrolipoamide acetyltransferase)